MGKRLKVQTEKIETRERAEEVVGEIALVEILRDALTADMEAAIQQVREGFEARLMSCAISLEQKLPAIQAWAEANPELFKEKKSLPMVHGIIGFRTGMHQCKTLRGLTWEKVKALLINQSLGYTRSTTVVDKDALIAERDKLGAEGLAKRGVQVFQEETFFVEPKREEVPK